MHRAIRFALIPLLSLAAHATGATRVCIGGDLDHLTKAETAACWASAAQVGRNAAKFHAPEDWHFFIICTEEDWKNYASFSKNSAAHLALVGADTNIQERVTFFRGGWLPGGDSPIFDRIVAHEVASAVMHTTDETIIAKQVAVWLPQAAGTELTLEASNRPR